MLLIKVSRTGGRFHSDFLNCFHFTAVIAAPCGALGPGLCPKAGVRETGAGRVTGGRSSGAAGLEPCAHPQRLALEQLLLGD